MVNIVYSNAHSSWEEALPLGNGHFGAMLYHQDNELICAVNHYDVYYKKLHFYSDIFAEANRTTGPTNTSEYEAVQQRAMAAHADPNDAAHYNYNYVLEPDMQRRYGVSRPGKTLPMAGELKIMLNDAAAEAAEFSGCLDVERAEYRYCAAAADGRVAVSAIVAADRDVILAGVEQTGGTKIKGLHLSVPAARYLERWTEYRVLDENTVYLLDGFYPDGENREGREPYKYIFMLRCRGAQCVCTADAGGARIELGEAGERFLIAACIVTEEETKHLLAAAAQRLDEACAQEEAVRNDHRLFWSDFRNEANIAIPDKFLEKLWRVNRYVLECCSGRGARLYEQACGLNGLWDIKQPTQWGSSWYWDVNIQQSFWPVYTGNRLATAQAFNDGLLSYVGPARKRAVESYGFRGIAPDYPFPFYIDIWPWCAQHLWWYFAYSGDLAFLREKAYPVFRDLLLFYEDHLKYDEAKRVYYTFPDMSPEQGPMGMNATITLACLKYLLTFSIRSNELLHEDESDRRRWENIRDNLAPYPKGESAQYGKIIKDAEWAPLTQFLAHSGLLMPIYPVGEISKRSGADLLDIARNTLKYAEELQCLGTHNFGWMACTAARLGLGDETLRILYEKGIAFMLRTNGLFAEETERWIQNCLTASAPVYSPALIEAGSALAAAVHEMLLQSFDGLIEVFPALPEGRISAGPSRSKFTGAPLWTAHSVRAWNDCSFDRLLAEGAFVVSAVRSNGRTERVELVSRAGNEAKLVHPFAGRDFRIWSGDRLVDYVLRDGVVSFATVRGAAYLLRPEPAEYRTEEIRTGDLPGGQEANRPDTYLAPTMRRVFLGKDEHTAFLRQLDHVTFDYFQGDIRTSRVAVYRFDCGLPGNGDPKDYGSSLPMQFHACGKDGLDFIKISRDSLYSNLSGFGWEAAGDLEGVDRNGPDVFRRDCIRGRQPNAFKLELPAGQYQLFIGTGDAGGKTLTQVSVNGQRSWHPKRATDAGRYEAIVLPVLQAKDGVMEIGFSTVGEYRWNVSMLIVNRLL